MKKLLLIPIALLIAGVIIYTVIANLDPRGGQGSHSGEYEELPGDAVNTTAVQDGTLAANVIHYPFDKDYNKENDFIKFDYITVDFDISTAGTNGTYPTEGIKFYISYASDASEGDANIANFYVLNGGDGHHYLGTKASAPTPSAKARLSATNGIYDHLTFICQIDKTEGALSSVTVYAYANGNFVAKTTKEASGNCSFTRFFMGKAKSQGEFDSGCGISYKNFVAYAYNAGSEKSAQLKAILDAETPLYNDTTERVVYNANYETPDASKNYVKINEEKYTLIGKALDRISTLKTGDVITVSGRSLSDITVPSGVEGFTVRLERNATFSLSAESDSLYVNDGGVYRFQKKNVTVIDDCGTGLYGESHVLNGKTGTSGTTSLGFALNNSAKSTHIRVTHVDSAYVRIHYDNANGLGPALSGDTTITAYEHMEREAELAWRAHSTHSEKTDLKNLRYLTLDFDFATDAYAYTYKKGDKTSYVTAKDDAEFERKTGISEYESRDLAFPLSADGTLKLTPVFVSSKNDEAPSAAFSPYGSNDNWEIKNACTLAVTKSKGEWCIKPNVSGSSSVKLSGEVGVFDHITFVFEIKADEDKTVIYPHVYVNGEYLASLSALEMSQGAKYNHFYQLKINFGKELRVDKNDKTLDTPSLKMFDRYSLAFDNMVLTYYDSEDLERTTLDELLGEKAPLYTMTGVVYGENYTTPIIVPNAKVDGDEKKDES